MMPSMLPLILFISTFINVSAFSRPLQSRVSLRNGFNPTTTYELRNSHLLASQTTESSRSSLQGGKTLTPKEILQHDFYLSDIFDIQSNTVDDEPLPLYAALRSIIEAIEKILEECSSTAGNSALLRFLDNTTILRIELSVAAVQAVDPLCWLHAQQLSISKIRRKLSSAQKSEDTSLPVIYLNDAEGRVEAAVIGKSPSFSDSWDPFVGKRIWDIVDEEKISEDFGGVNGVNGVKGANGINGEKDGNIKPPMLKEGDLPKGARVYGASRFDWKFYEEKMRNDKEYKRRSKRYDSIGKNIEDDWDGFGGDRGGYWILPVVELRREMLDNSSNRHTNKGSCEFCSKGTRKVTLAVNIQNSSPSSFSVLGNKHRYGWRDAASQTLTILQELTDELSPAAPTTTLPPVLTRSESTGRGRENEDSGYAFERSVTEALKRIHHYDSVTSGNTSNPPAQTANKEESLNGLPIAGNKNKCESLRKVVLARKVDLNLGASLNGLDALMRMKFGGHVGHLFYLATGEDNNELRFNREFIGCTPERLFQVKDRGNERIVTSEALAGTRIRGLTPKADAELLQELLSSEKDMLENEITGNFIMDAFKELEANGWLDKRSPDFFVESSDDENKSHTGRFFVRRLRHLQHICQTFEGRLSKNANIIDVSRSLLEHLHPTPAVCGDSPIDALDFIRQFETKASFDRGYYTGPIGYIGTDSADIFVAIRSALITNYNNDFVDEKNAVIERPQSKVSIFAGAGIVKGSTVQGEWTETSHKLGVMSSIFPPSPITLQIASIPNVAWSTAFIEELVRCGVTQFYICPGSRNTPLTAAIYKSTRSNTGVVRAISVHDERGAGFRALGYSRQNGRPAAIVTSSGTAVANLYPSVVESSSDGVPLLVITADRPYENRDNGSNQSVDQVKIFSSTYVRWFRDIPPPSDDVPVSLALSDANHAVTLANQLAGPVHLNIQFRENLAPDQGPIRNDNRIGSVTKFHTLRFTDVPGFARWSQSGSRWQRAFYPDKNVNHSIIEVAELILQSRRGIVVAGNLRLSKNDANEADSLTSIISHFATVAGMPILAGVQSGALRRERPVVPFAEHLLKHPSISKGLRPDFILQLGSPLISTEISKMITNAVIHNVQTSHVLVQRLYPNERADPEFTVTHRVSSDIGNFLKSLTSYIESLGQHESMKCSELTPLLHLGRELQKEMPSIIEETSRAVDSQTVEKTPNDSILTEPEIMSAISDVLSELSSEKLRGSSLFLSNSMPVRDGEFFLYPRQVTENDQTAHMQTNLSGFPLSVNVNRGASGIDGIISTAIGCSDTFTPTTLVCGDVSALHDLNGLYGLTSDLPSLSNAQSKPQSRVPLTTIIVNNGGGAIFSFLPIAKHGQDVGFEEFWGTPTKSISFRKGADAFGLPYRYANSFESFREAYRSSLLSGRPEIIEARVIDRSTNVDIHQRITSTAIQFVTKLVSETSSDECDLSLNSRINLPIKRYTNENITKSSNRSKKLLLIHGWMGDKTEWDFVGAELVKDLPHEWDIISIDLPGHGEAPYILSPIQQMMRTALSLNSVHENADFYSSGKFSIDAMAKAVCESLQNDHGIKSLDAIAGYSLGGRIALAMNRLCSTNTNMNAVEQDNGDKLITKQTRLILLGANPGKLPFDDHTVKTESDNQRVRKDRLLAQSLLSSLYKTYLIPIGSDLSHLSKFVTKWYGNKVLWGDLQGRYPHKFKKMINKRIMSLSERRHEIASVLYECSPPLNPIDDWKKVTPAKTLYIAGSLDKKYSFIGRQWEKSGGVNKYVEISNAGHALLVEQPREISSALVGFLKDARIANTLETSKEISDEDANVVNDVKTDDAEKLDPAPRIQIGVMDFESFSITVGSNNAGIRGIGWGSSAHIENELKSRSGFIISIASADGMAVGVGEVSPLNGLHKESAEEAAHQLNAVKKFLSCDNSEERPSFLAREILSMNGSLSRLVQSILISSGIDDSSLAASVKSGIEMAILAIASQAQGSPLPQALAAHYWSKGVPISSSSFGLLPVNGLITRGEYANSSPEHSSAAAKEITFTSLKIKVAGRCSPKDDALSLVRWIEPLNGPRKLNLRADANRAWDLPSALEFVEEAKNANSSIPSILEFIEEPLKKQAVDKKWSIVDQVIALDNFWTIGEIHYALDESLADLAEDCDYNFREIAADLRRLFGDRVNRPHGCAAFVLKPALIGLELSLQLAKLAHEEFQISAVFSSSFDSGVGLAFTSILAAVSDCAPFSSNVKKYAHGVGTFEMLGGDTLSPSFESYVSKEGLVNVNSLSRALYGLSLDEISDRLPVLDPALITRESTISPNESDEYLAKTSTSTSGRDIAVSVSLPLPFSDVIASSRFTDLPQMSRWSPWLNSVTYLDSAGLTEWNLNVRGVKFSWRARSEVLENPKGIKWESISGLKNRGFVEFEPTSDDSCLMKLEMSIIMPYVLVSLFQGMPSVVQEFVQNKLLKWSLEMFRDAVKADLALERGDIELGDALFGAVEGRANALEEALK